MKELSSSSRPKGRLTRLIAISCLLLIGVVLALSFGVFWREPMYKGQSIGQWLDRACPGMDGNDAQGNPLWQVRYELTNFGTAAVPYLVDRLRVTDRWRNTWTSVRTFLPASWQQRFPVKPPAKEIHYGAARSLVAFGPAAKSAVPDLVRLLPEITHAALDALTAIGPDAKAALPALHAMLTNQDLNLRADIARTIWAIGRETNLVLEVCTNAMALSTNCVNAPGLLIQLKTAAAPAAPVALNVLRDTNSSSGMRANTAILLGVARVDSPEIRAALLAGTQEGQGENLRENSAMALWAFDPKYAPLATRLVMENFVQGKKRFPEQDMDWTLWLDFRGLDPRDCIPTLKQLMENGSPEIRAQASQTLDKIERRLKVQANQ